MTATITDVAREAGVSKGTVSKYLNGTPYVSAATKKRIEEAVRKLNFQPNRVAQGLSKRRSHCIGVIVANILNPFYPVLISGIEEVATQRGYTLLLASSDGDAEKERRIVQAMRQRQVDGIVFASVRMADREVTTLAKTDTKVVLASRSLPDAQVDCVVTDSCRGAREATHHLLGHGHRRVAYIAGPQTIVQFQERLQGYMEALERAGLSLEPDLVIHTGTDSASGRQAVEQLMRLDTPPTAIFAATDNLAFGVLQACHINGWSVPDQLALVGFDNVPFSEIALVPLTTVDSHILSMGRHAAKVLTDRIDESVQHPARHTERVRMILEPQLVVRNSCGCSAEGAQPPQQRTDREGGVCEAGQSQSRLG